MLKIVAHERDRRSTLRLEGDVIGLWVDELRRSSEGPLALGAELTVDLTDVGFVDREGIELLQRLGARGVAVVNASRFVAEQLKAQTR